MGYLFISYSRQQLYFAESITLFLQGAGVETWFDLQKLAPGLDWGDSLKEGYSNCDRLILVVSQAALRSAYVQVEWETALKNGREVILVLTEAVELPESLRECAAYDARGNFKRTMAGLVAYLGAKNLRALIPSLRRRNSPCQVRCHAISGSHCPCCSCRLSPSGSSL